MDIIKHDFPCYPSMLSHEACLLAHVLRLNAEQWAVLGDAQSLSCPDGSRQEGRVASQSFPSVKKNGEFGGVQLRSYRDVVVFNGNLRHHTGFFGSEMGGFLMFLGSLKTPWLVLHMFQY